MTSEDVDKMIDDFMELSQISPNLATKIFQVSMLQTGLSQNPISLFSILPNAIYNKFLESSLTSYRANTTNFVESFYNSFYQNNWNTPSLVKYVKPNKFAKEDMQAGKAAIMFSSDDFIKTKIDDEYLLLKKTFTKVIKGQKKNFYTVINKLGVTDYKNQHFYKEYSLTEKPVSIIPDNNLKGINKIPVYQGIIEDKVDKKEAVKEVKETTKKKYTKKENKTPTESDKKWGMIIWNKYKNRILAKHKEAKAIYYIQRVANKGYKDTVKFIEKCY